MSVFFWLSAAALAYCYVAFPLLLKLAARGRRSAPPPGGPLPTVSVIVAAYNEERVIGARIANLRAQTYPADKLEIIVASDGSTDGTARLAVAGGARVLDSRERRGRAAVHNEAAAAARGEVLIFTDAETSFEPGFVSKAVARLQDPAYGCGAGDYTFAPRGDIGRDEGAYWRIEKEMRRLEFELGILPFASGGCFVVRRELFNPIPPHSDIDCWVPYQVLARGKRVFYAAEARAFDVTVADAREHFGKRRRTAEKGLAGALAAVPLLLRARRWGPLWALVSHRILRWLSPCFMLALLVSSALLDGPVPAAVLLAQAAFYALALVGWTAPGTSRPATAAYGFVVANAAFLSASLSLARGERTSYYTPVSQS